MGLRKSSESPRDLWIPHSDALPLSHRDSTVSEVYYEVHITRVLHTTRISNVNSVMFVDRNRRDGKFSARLRNKDVFPLKEMEFVSEITKHHEPEKTIF